MTVTSPLAISRSGEWEILCRPLTTGRGDRPSRRSVAALPPCGAAEVPDEPVDPGPVEEALPAARERGRVDVAGARGAQREVRGDDPGDVAQPKTDAKRGERAGGVLGQNDAENERDRD